MSAPPFRKFALAVVAIPLLWGGARAQDTSTGPIDNWRASKLLGVVVYDQGHERVGSISELLVDRTGRVVKIVLNVEGQGGTTDRMIALGFDALTWTNLPPPGTRGEPKPATNVDSNAATASGEVAHATSPGGAPLREKIEWYPDHAILTAGREQLRAEPTFAY